MHDFLNIFCILVESFLGPSGGQFYFVDTMTEEFEESDQLDIKSLQNLPKCDIGIQTTWPPTVSFNNTPNVLYCWQDSFHNEASTQTTIVINTIRQ